MLAVSPVAKKLLAVSVAIWGGGTPFTFNSYQVRQVGSLISCQLLQLGPVSSLDPKKYPLARARPNSKLKVSRLQGVGNKKILRNLEYA